MRSRTLIAALAVAAVVIAAAPQAGSRQAASPRLYLVVAGYRASVGMSPSGSLIGQCGAYCRFAFPTGTTSVTLTARPATGTTFLGWRQAFPSLPSPCSGTAPVCTVNLVSLVAVKAAFNPVSLSVRSSGGGFVTFLDNRPSCDFDCRKYNYDTTAHLRATADERYVFNGWTGCSSAEPTCAVRMDANRIVTAQFRCPGPICSKQFPVTYPTKVTVEVVGHGSVLGPQLNCPKVNCTRKDFERGSTISLRAKPDAGALFGGWIKLVAVTCSKQAERCTFAVFKDSAGKTPELRAYFKKAPPPPPPPKPPPPPPPKPPPPPPPSPPPPPPPPQPIRCRVPKVRGMRLGPAKARIRSRHCSVGRIRRAHSKPSLRRRVIRQRPPAGAVRPRGFPVKLVVGRR
jgi:hypothetical protein